MWSCVNHFISSQYFGIDGVQRPAHLRTEINPDQLFITHVIVAFVQGQKLSKNTEHTRYTLAVTVELNTQQCHTI